MESSITTAFQNKIGKSSEIVFLIVLAKCSLDMVLSAELEHLLLTFPKMEEKTTIKPKKPIKIYNRNSGYRIPIGLNFFQIV